MQSELACHIGLKGKFFCRVCRVKGSDQNDATAATTQPTGDNGQSDQDGAGSDVEGNINDAGSDGGVQVGTGRKKRLETMSEMVERVRRFLHVRIQA